MYNNGGWQAKVTVEKNKTKKMPEHLPHGFTKSSLKEDDISVRDFLGL